MKKGVLKNKIEKNFILIFLYLIVLTLFVTTFFSCQNIAFAGEEKYIFIPYSGELKDLENAKKSNIYLTTNSGAEIFLPESYYLKFIKVDETNKNLLHVEFNGVNGVIEKSKIGEPKVINELNGQNAYPTFNLKSKGFEKLGITYDDTFTYSYLGVDKNNNKNIFVKITKDNDSKIFSIEKTKFEDFTIPLHNITKAEKENLSKKGADGAAGIINATPPKDNLIKALLIAGIVIPSIIIIVLLFIPRKKKQTFDSFIAEKEKDDLKHDYSRDYNHDRRKTSYPRNYRNDYDRYNDYKKENSNKYNGHDYDNRRYDRNRQDYGDYLQNDRDKRY